MLCHAANDGLGGTVWYSRPWRWLTIIFVPSHGLEYQTVPPLNVRLTTR